MGRNVDLCDMLGAPEKLACRQCGQLSDTGFYDYDIDGEGYQAGKWRLHFCCAKCKHEDVWAIDPGNGHWQIK
jgi:hypothetical protein